MIGAALTLLLSTGQVRIPLPLFDRFVSGPWRDKFAATYFKRDAAGHGTRWVGQFGIDGKLLAERPLANGWTVASYDDRGRARPFFLKDQSEVPPARRNLLRDLGPPVFSGTLKFFLEDPILAISEDGRVAAIASPAYATLLAANRKGVIVFIDGSADEPTLTISDRPSSWRRIKVDGVARPPDLVLNLALSEAGRCYFFSEFPRKAGETGIDVVSCDLQTGRTRVVVTLPTLPDRPGNYEPGPSRELLGCTSGGPLLVYWNGFVCPVNDAPRTDRFSAPSFPEKGDVFDRRILASLKVGESPIRLDRNLDVRLDLRGSYLGPIRSERGDVDHFQVGSDRGEI